MECMLADFVMAGVARKEYWIVIFWLFLFAQAVQEREDALRAAQLSYTDATFHVELVQQSDVTGSAIITGEKVLDAIGP